ncbi:MAG: hypothetical protein HY226_06805 [Candidatus Vogelbacteria bacterium]|nr:hypothetical protein [Candidatus Vogelbacteria bacterium]
MFGLVIATFWALYAHSISGLPSGVILIKASTGLFYWYALWAVLGGLFTTVVSFLLPLFGGIIAGCAAIKAKCGWQGALVAAGSGGFLGSLGGLYLVISLFISASLKVGGTFLMSTSVVNAMSATPAWDDTRMLIGAIMLLLGLVFSRSSSSSSSSSNKNNS